MQDFLVISHGIPHLSLAFSCTATRLKDRLFTKKIQEIRRIYSMVYHPGRQGILYWKYVYPGEVLLGSYTQCNNFLSQKKSNYQSTYAWSISSHQYDSNKHNGLIRNPFPGLLVPLCSEFTSGHAYDWTHTHAGQMSSKLRVLVTLVLVLSVKRSLYTGDSVGINRAIHDCFWNRFTHGFAVRLVPNFILVIIGQVGNSFFPPTK